VEHRVVRLDKTAEGIRVAVAGGVEQLALGHGCFGEVILGGTSLYPLVEDAQRRTRVASVASPVESPVETDGCRAPP
jgi:hypothetical protein